MAPSNVLTAPPRADDATWIEALTRRKLLTSAAAAALLAACSRIDTERGAGDRAGWQRVTIDHKFGSTGIDARPSRVVTFGPTDEDTVLALGMVPVGLTDWWDNYAEGRPWPWAQPKLGETKYAVIPLDGTVHYEEIAGLKPDLIIGQYCGMRRDEYDRLSRIAPTVAQSGEYEDWRTPWPVMARTIAKALGKSAEAEGLVAGVNAAYERVKQANPKFSATTVLYVERGDGRFTIRGANEPRVQALTNMGLKVPAKYADLGTFGQEFGDEQLRVLDEVDAVVWVTEPADRDGLRAHPLFQGLRVARENRHVFVTDETLRAAINWSSVLSLPYAVEGLAPLIAGVL